MIITNVCVYIIHILYFVFQFFLFVFSSENAAAIKQLERQSVVKRQQKPNITFRTIQDFEEFENVDEETYNHLVSVYNRKYNLIIVVENFVILIFKLIIGWLFHFPRSFQSHRLRSGIFPLHFPRR